MKFVLSHGKKVLIIGLALLVAGASIVSALLLFPRTETVMSESVDTTTVWSYNSQKFRAEEGYWLDLSILSNASSTIHVIGQTTGEIFKVDGTAYVYTVRITAGDVYQVQVENKANYNYWFSTVYVDNHIFGNFHLMRTPTYFFDLLMLGVNLLTAGFLIIPSVAFFEHRTRQRAKLLYQCQRCGKTVQTGIQTCPFCKLDLTKYWVTCKYCGKFYDSHLEKCPKCGAETHYSPELSPSKPQEPNVR